MHIIQDESHVSFSSSTTIKTHASNQNLITLQDSLWIVFHVLLTALVLRGQFPEGKFQELKSYDTHIPESVSWILLQELKSAIILTFTSQ